MAKGKYEQWLTPEGLLKLEAWARNGLTDEQIANNLGVKVWTLYNWKNKFSQISHSLKKGKEVVDIQVENALLKRALGYKFTEVTRERVVDYEDGSPSGSHMDITKTVTKEVQPDVTAQIFWLKNRKPETWRDKKDIDLNAEIKNPYDNLSLEELERMRTHDK